MQKRKRSRIESDEEDGDGLHRSRAKRPSQDNDEEDDFEMREMQQVNQNDFACPTDWHSEAGAIEYVKVHTYFLSFSKKSTLFN